MESYVFKFKCQFGIKLIRKFGSHPIGEKKNDRSRHFSEADIQYSCYIYDKKKDSSTIYYLFSHSDFLNQFPLKMNHMTWNGKNKIDDSNFMIR